MFTASITLTPNALSISISGPLNEQTYAVITALYQVKVNYEALDPDGDEKADESGK